ncbi:MAG: hypothetical protein ACREXX_20655 [Gammaproteobacteria bacterium]
MFSPQTTQRAYELLCLVEHSWALKERLDPRIGQRVTDLRTKRLGGPQAQQQALEDVMSLKLDIHC